MIAELHGVQVTVEPRAVLLKEHGVTYVLQSFKSAERVTDFIVSFVLKGEMSSAAKRAYNNLGITKKQFMDLMQICQAHQNLLQ